MSFDGSTWPGSAGAAKPKPKPAPRAPTPKPFAPKRPHRKPPPGWRPRPKPPAGPPAKPPAPMRFPPKPPNPGRTPTPKVPKPPKFGRKDPLSVPIVKPGYRWLPRPPSWIDPAIDILGDLIFRQPDWLPSYNPGSGWTLIQTCGQNPLYNEGQVLTVAKGCTSLGCLTAQASPAPGYVTCQPGCVCTAGVPCFRLRVDDVRFLGPPVNAWRAHYRAQYRWDCPAVGNPGPARPREVVVPRWSPEGAPDPWAQNPPGMPMPAPVPVPFPMIPPRDPNEWLDPREEPKAVPAPRTAPGVGVSPLPGGGAIVLPIPPGWIFPGPSPGVNPGPQPAPSPGTQPAPGPAPVPTPVPVPPPGTAPFPPPGTGTVVPAPGSGVDVDPNGNVRPSPRTSTHARRPPRKREKEKKVRTGPIFNMIWKMFGNVTEGLDALDVAYKSIPCSVKYAAGMMGRNVGPAEKAAFVASHVGDINPQELGREYLKNQAEDWFYGMMSRGQPAFYQALHAATGISAGGGQQVDSQKFGPGLFHEAQKKEFDKRWKRYNDTVERFRSARERELKRKYGKLRHKVYANASDFKKAAYLKPPKQFFPENPIIDNINNWIDGLFGPKSEDFGCCAGKRVRCGTRNSQAKKLAERMRR